MEFINHAFIHSLCVILVLQREIAASGGLLVHRSMYSRLNLTHGLSVRRFVVQYILQSSTSYLHVRDTAMMMVSVMDPPGTESRQKSRLKKRVYCSKVSS